MTAFNASGDAANASNESIASTPAGPSSSTTTTLTSTADATIRGGTYSMDNLGSDPTLIVKFGSGSYDRESLVTFDISSLTGPVQTAKLRLYGVLNTSAANGVGFAVNAIENTTWSESNVTYDTRPAVSATVLANSKVTSQSGEWVEVDLSSYVAAARAAGKTQVSFNLSGIASSTPFISFASRESGANAPQLVVTAG